MENNVHNWISVRIKCVSVFSPYIVEQEALSGVYLDSFLGNYSENPAKILEVIIRLRKCAGNSVFECDITSPCILIAVCNCALFGVLG